MAYQKYVTISNHWQHDGQPFAVPEELAKELLLQHPGMQILNGPVFWLPSDKTPLKDWLSRPLGRPHDPDRELINPAEDYRKRMNDGFIKAYGTGLNPCGEIVLRDSWGGECWIGRKLPEPPKPVRNKRDYYTRYIAGEFGNRLQVWATKGEWENSGFIGPIGIRNRKPDSPFCRYDIPHRLVNSVVDEFLSKGCPLSDMTFNEAAPESDLTIQGEFCINYDGQLALVYSHVKRQMRIALKQEPKYATGNHARQILKHFADNDSYEWMDWLLGAYPDHTIEFSTYRRNLGSIPRRNTLIWEVRAY